MPYKRYNDFRRSVFAGLSVATTLLLGPSAHAQQQFTFLGDMSESRVLGLSADGGASYFRGYAGRYKGQLDNGPVLNLFCVDLTHHIKAGDQYLANTQFRLTDPAGARSGAYYMGGLASALNSADYKPSGVPDAAEKARRASQAAFLAEKYLNANAFDGLSGSVNATDNLVALNLAEWDIIQDGGDGLNRGSIRADASALGAYSPLISYFQAQAQALSQAAAAHQPGVNGVAGTGGSAYWIQAPRDGLVGHLQDYVYVRPGSAPAAVPEPGATAMLGCLSVVVAGVGLRRRRTKAS